MRYFVVSDLHSHLSPLLKALKEKGFDSDNDTLVICGDVFDRGDETLPLYGYLRLLPNLILIRGNHELLYEELLEKPWPDNYDYSNGTVKTFCQIAGIDHKKMSREYYIVANALYGTNFRYNEEIPKTWKQVKEKVMKSEITRWIKSDIWKNYLELNDYVLVHSWVPVICHDNLPPQFVKGRDFEWNPNWRNTEDITDWNDATWGSPVENYKNNLWQEDKTLVVGHWHCNLFHEAFEKDMSENYDIFYGDRIIALDACTFLTKQVNVLVIEE